MHVRCINAWAFDGITYFIVIVIIVYTLIIWIYIVCININYINYITFFFGKLVVFGTLWHVFVYI